MTLFNINKKCQLTLCLLGYSVFAVTQADPDAPLGLPRTEADAIASTLPEPSSASRANPQRPPAKRFGQATSTDDSPEDMDLEDEDYELQIALQASLMNPDLTTGMLIPSEFSFLLLLIILFRTWIQFTCTIPSTSTIHVFSSI